MVDKEMWLETIEKAKKTLYADDPSQNVYVFHGRTIDKLLTKYIPIAWLEEKAEHYQRAYEAEVEQNGYDASRYYLDMYNAINTLIDEWETENG